MKIQASRVHGFVSRTFTTIEKVYWFGLVSNEDRPAELSTVSTGSVTSSPVEPHQSSHHLQTGDDLAVDDADDGRTSSATENLQKINLALKEVLTFYQDRKSWREQGNMRYSSSNNNNSIPVLKLFH